ncbi:MAG TPA: glycosyltransferase, partial [Phenylobacterium sp.]|nr:glycosyltransferase [Phenylobacterium sp.]
SRYYADAFKPHEMATFAWNRLDALPGLLGGLLSDEPIMAAMARAGARKAQSEHTWAQRAARLVKVVKQAR